MRSAGWLKTLALLLGAFLIAALLTHDITTALWVTGFLVALGFVGLLIT